MSETDITPQEGMNPEPEVVEETVEGETTETPVVEESDNEGGDTVSRAQFNQVLARAKKAEEKLKATPKPTSTKNVNSTAIPDDVVDARILKSQGMKDELLSELKTIAKLRGKSILECQTDPIFLAIKENAEREAKNTKLPASKGSAQIKKVKGFQTRGLSDADFKELWKEQNSR